MDFKEILGRGEAVLREAKINEVQESLVLDFKSQSQEEGGSLFSEGRLTKAGRQSLGKALSAFSNSAGGLLVIGVKCKSVEGVDCIQDLEPFPLWQRALSDVSSATGDLLQPKNDGINVHGFAAKDDDAIGYIAIDVPRSERRPHRSEASGQKQYFKRSGSASYAMEHFDIEDAFRRQSVPLLNLETAFIRRSKTGGIVQFDLDFSLLNSGISSAQFPALSMILPSLLTKAPLRQISPDILQSYSRGYTTFNANADFLIHPGDSRRICTFMIAIESSAEKEPLKVNGLDIDKARLQIPFRISAMHMRAKEEVLTLLPSHFWALENDL
jgi:hypothetical protein